MNNNTGNPTSRSNEQGAQSGLTIENVNAHLHTPYSFSAFDSIDQALDMALSENVKVVGINDFYATDGYQAWDTACRNRNLYPLFNIEFISLNREDQAKGIRVNDPNNPGRTYLSGKGLAYPVSLKDPYLKQLNEVKAESNHHVERMCGKLNELLEACSAPFSISFEEVRQNLTRGSIRERHLAKALRMKVSESFPDQTSQLAFYEKVFGGKALKSRIDDVAAIENEIRGNLLKAGGAAFVPESPEAFLDMEVVRQIILHAGGLPTYPFLADDAKGNFTDFEQDKVKVVGILKERGIASVEFITTRNTVAVLEEYAGYCWENGMVVTFGSEHNTPAMEPISLYAVKGTELSPVLKEINYKGACIVAAHQELVRQGKQGYIDQNGVPDLANRDQYVKMGSEIINKAIEGK